MRQIELSDLRVMLQDVIDQYPVTKSAPLLVTRVNHGIEDLFHRLDTDDVEVGLWPGVRLTGLTLQMDELKRDVLRVRKFNTAPSPQTDRYCRRQFSRHPGVCTYLGHHMEVDMYWAEQGPLPPTILLRWGASAEENFTWNPSLTPEPPDCQYYGHFVEAKIRIDQLIHLL
jgi:hypothetical protein